MLPEPASNGAIWIQAGLDGSTASIVLDGSNPNLGSWANYSLTLNGGSGYVLWSGAAITLKGVFVYGNTLPDSTTPVPIIVRACPLP